MFYEECLKICQQYLGNNGRNFLDRQIIYHLNKQPQNLIIADKIELAKWLGISAILVIGKENAEKLKEQIISLKE